MDFPTTFKDWVEKPHPNDRKVCSCGELQCHSILHCHKCGTEFKPMAFVSVADSVRMKLNFNKRDNTLSWFAALYERSLKSLEIKPEWNTYFK